MEAKLINVAHRYKFKLAFSLKWLLLRVFWSYFTQYNFFKFSSETRIWDENIWENSYPMLHIVIDYDAWFEAFLNSSTFATTIRKQRSKF